MACTGWKLEMKMEPRDEKADRGRYEGQETMVAMEETVSTDRGRMAGDPRGGDTVFAPVAAPAAESHPICAEFAAIIG